MRNLLQHHRIMWLLLALVLMPGFSTPVLAATGWRCGNLFVEEGVDSLQVLSSCGEPISKEKTYIDQYGEVQKWAYGPDAGYYYILYFFAGKLVEIQSIRQE